MQTYADQQALFNQLITEPAPLTKSRVSYICWAAALASREPALVHQVEQALGPLPQELRQEVEFAVMRMSVTNPYFVARNVGAVNNPTDLSALAMRPLSEIAPADSVAYHYACVAVSSLNGGFVCLGSHIQSLRQSGESEQAIDTALKLAAALCGLRAQAFLQSQ